MREHEKPKIYHLLATNTIQVGLAGLSIFSLVTGLFHILIVVLLQELIVFALQVTILWCVRNSRFFTTHPQRSAHAQTNVAYAASVGLYDEFAI